MITNYSCPNCCNGTNVLQELCWRGDPDLLHCGGLPYSRSDLDKVSTFFILSLKSFLINNNRNGILIDEESEKAVINTANKRHKLILIGDDEGQYECQVSNEVGQTKKSIWISGRCLKSGLLLVLSLGTKCDPSLKSVYKIGTTADATGNTGDFEVKICTAQENSKDEIMSMYKLNF